MHEIGVKEIGVKEIGVRDQLFGYAYYQLDHLGTPQQLVNKTGLVVWKVKALSFGDTIVEVNTVTNNLRFPGQYYDAETGLFYNYHRFYSPQTGRYTTSDPIGLLGGLNTYGYALQNPLIWTDMYGLAPGDFYAANDMLKKIATERNWKVPDFKFNSPPNMAIDLKGATPYFFDFKTNSVEINTYSLEFDIDDMFNECLSDTVAQSILNTYIHETIHANGGLAGSLKVYLQDEFGLGSGHDNIYNTGNKTAEKYASEFNKLRKSKGYASDELKCNCK